MPTQAPWRAAGKGVSVREFKLAPGHGCADYLLFVEGKAVGPLKAKPEGYIPSGMEPQANKYATGMPKGIKTRVLPLAVLCCRPAQTPGQ